MSNGFEAGRARALRSRAMLAALLLFAVSAALAQPPAEEVTYVVPIKDMIERGLVHFVNRSLDEAEEAGASAVILDMDTPGGRLDATEQIIDRLTRLDAATYTYVNPNAISAGAIIAMATDHIYMAPAGRIGDAMPIMMSPLPMGGPQEMPEGLREKAISPTVAMIRSAAQRKGHDPELAEAMVRPEFEYVVDGEVICPAGQLLTLTAQDAARLVGEDQRPLLSEGTVEDLDSLLRELDLADTRVVYVELTAGEKIARVIEGFPVSGLLLAAGLLCLYIEIKTPGFGIPGIAGISLLALWFWGHHIAGLAGALEMVLFVFGTSLLFVELFITPGFGVLGFAGLSLMLVSLLLAMVEHYPGTPWYDISEFEVQRSVVNLSLSMILTFLAALVIGRYLPGLPAFQRIMLTSSVSGEQGYRASEPTDALTGLVGVSETALRPAGIGVFGDKRLSVVSQGEFVPANTPIRIAETHGNRIVVVVAGEAQPPAAG